MSSEQREQQSISPLCANKCGFYGNPANQNLCSKCYHEYLKRENRNSSCRSAGNSSGMNSAVNAMSQQQDVTTSVEERTLATATSSITSDHNLNGSSAALSSSHSFSTTSTSTDHVGSPDSSSPCNASVLDTADCEFTTAEQPSCVKSATSQVDRSRCWHCKKRVGLLGLPCRCGNTFCAEHLHSDTHKCTFDYKNFERENLRKQNTKVVAEKLRKL